MNKTFKARKKPIIVEVYQTDKYIEIETLEGIMKAKPADYIKAIKGELYPYDKEIFEQTYERVEE